MPILSLRLSDAEYKEIKTLATENNATLNDYVKSKLFTHNISQENILKLDIVIERIKEQYNTGDKFSLPDLFDEEEWAKFTNTVSIGRTFRKLSKQKDSIVSNIVIFIEKKSGHSAIYQLK